MLSKHDVMKGCKEREEASNVKLWHATEMSDLMCT